ncbi:peptidoglycan/xylan/chitin deacetylase (PgdA/CDA1 family) [Kribbella amoyensis]|uniref:Peptidoglycan/xylan/chitin deacetylase (PgdA/CDA1 family) n=1 Tax=Kribbella amoyensis TaxID=996641 RepID=A0A561B7R0_9ACTN|nr:polysaccharide deacetylase family protein [Kribbella amoyensis]TWD75006.1 peptidoglycan/xylan/chitin deacetylase (PgdA/CDA1 family) [Kribbella amoyensis]
MIARVRTEHLRSLAAPAALLLSVLIIVLISFANSPGRHNKAGGSPAAAAPPAKAGTTPAPPAKPVYLTFDDGPEPKYTPQILAILRTFEAKATFFEVGRNVEKHPDLTKRIHADGHSVQNHTWTHADLRLLSWPKFEEQVSDTDRAIQAQTAVTPRCVRPPYGAVNKLVQTRATGLGKKLTLWDVDSRDWTRPGAAAITKRVLAGVKPGTVILFHDGGGDRTQTIAALPTILKTLRARGYSFVAVC